MQNARKDQKRFEQLVELAEGKLTQAEATTLRASLSDDEQVDAAWLTQLFTKMEAVTLDAPSANVRATLLQTFKQRRGKPTLAERMVTTIRAALQFDSWGSEGALALAGARSASGFDRQLGYTSPELDVLLDVAPYANLRHISGQVLPKQAQTPPAFLIQLLLNETEVASTTTDQFGEFSLPPVAKGFWNIVICNETREIVLPTLHLSA